MISAAKLVYSLETTKSLYQYLQFRSGRWSSKQSFLAGWYQFWKIPCVTGPKRAIHSLMFTSFLAPCVCRHQFADVRPGKFVRCLTSWLSFFRRLKNWGKYNDFQLFRWIANKTHFCWQCSRLAIISLLIVGDIVIKSQTFHRQQVFLSRMTGRVGIE